MKTRMTRCATAGCLLFAALLAGCESADVVAPADVPDVNDVDADYDAWKLTQYMSGTESRMLPGGIAKLSVAPLAGSVLAAMWEPDLGGNLGQGDDDCDQVGLGFSFDFYGMPRTDVWVNSNGNMTFNGCNWKFYDTNVPDGANELVAPLYADLNPSTGGGVYYNTLGAAPARRFVATWSGVPEYLNYGSNSAQVQLFEGTNHIQFSYGSLTAGQAWQNVGISSGTGSFINSASGAAIPALSGTDLCYKADGGTYTQVDGVCDVVVPEVTASLTPVEGKSLKSKKGIFTAGFSCTDDSDPDPAATAMLNDVPVENGQVVDLRVKSEKSNKSNKSQKSEKSEKSTKSEKPLKIEAPSFALVAVCTDDFGNEGSVTVEPAFKEKSKKN